jgi:hypothetical protein
MAAAAVAMFVTIFNDQQTGSSSLVSIDGIALI